MCHAGSLGTLVALAVVDRFVDGVVASLAHSGVQFVVRDAVRRQTTLDLYPELQAGVVHRIQALPLVSVNAAAIALRAGVVIGRVHCTLYNPPI